MDSDLLSEARAAWRQFEHDRAEEDEWGDYLRETNPTLPRVHLDEKYQTDYIWRAYCTLHFDRYAVDFEPDVSDTWDM